MRAARATVLMVLLGFTLLLPGAGGPLAVAAAWAFCVVILAFGHARGVLSLPCLYLVMLGLFHLGLVVPIALGVQTVEPPSWLASPQLPLALGLFSTAAVAFTLGAQLSAAPTAGAAGSLPPQRQLLVAGSAVALLGAASLWVGVRQLGLLNARYAAYFERAMSEDVRLFGFGLMLFPIGLLVAAAGATPRQMYLLGGVLITVLGPLFLGGFRGPFLVQATALVAVWARKDARAARRLALVGVAAAIVLVPAVRLARNDEQSLSRGLAKLDPAAMLVETGGTIYPLVLTAERLAAGSEEPWMGRSYWMAVKRVIPNVALRWRARPETELTPSAWATRLTDRWTFEHGGGVGFSGVAEPYLNFATAGVVVFFLLLGYSVHRFDAWLGNDPFRGAIGAATFGFVLWSVRNDVMELFRALALASATVLAAWVVARLEHRRPVAATP